MRVKLRTSDVAKSILESTLVAPSRSDDGVLDVVASQEVACRWQIRNCSSRPIVNLQIGAGCQCQVKQAPPNTILPSETVELVVTLVPPNAGIADRVIPLRAKGSDDLLGTLAVRLRVKMSPPAWIVAPDVIEVRAIAGHPSSHEVVWDAVEFRKHPHWLESVEVCDPELAEVELKVDEWSWTEDQTMCLRKYRVTIHPLGMEQSNKNTTLLLKSSDQHRSIPIKLETLSAVTAFPRKVIFDAGREARRVTLVCRVPVDGDIVATFDRELLTVTPLSSAIDKVQAFEVMPRAVIVTNIETDVVFSTNGREQARLLVQMKP